MAKDKISIPSGSGGLMRYFDEKTSNIEMSPETVIVICAIVIIITIFLHVTKVFG